MDGTLLHLGRKGGRLDATVDLPASVGTSPDSARAIADNQSCPDPCFQSHVSSLHAQQEVVPDCIGNSISGLVDRSKIQQFGQRGIAETKH